MPQYQRDSFPDQVRREIDRMLEHLDPELPIRGTSVFQVREMKQRDFLRSVEVLAEATRKRRGVKEFGYHEEIPYQADPLDEDSVRYLIFEEWESVALFRNQWESEELKYFQDIVGDFVETTPDLDFYEAAAGGKALVLKTGLKHCWDPYSLDPKGKRIECKGTGQDGEYRRGAGFEADRFRDEGDGTITDRLTGLIWLKHVSSFPEVTWDDALKRARSLESGHHGLTDGSVKGQWRLPNVRELRSLLDYERGDPIVPKEVFPEVQSAIYWTSTTLVSNPRLAWMVTLGIGPAVFVFKSSRGRMWPVKGLNSRLAKTGQTECWNTDGTEIDCQLTGQDGDLQIGVAAPTQRFTDNQDGTVTDNLTGLVWTQDADLFGPRTWAQALEACNSLSQGSSYGLSDGSKERQWRLPNICEFESLVDYGTHPPSPSLPEGAVTTFKHIRPTSYWTSTTVSSAPTQAMFTILGVGPSIFENKEVPLLVWPVRDALPRR